MSSSFTYRWTAAENGKRLDTTITQSIQEKWGTWFPALTDDQIKNFSRTKVQKIIESGNVLKNNVPALQKDSIEAGDEIELTWQPQTKIFLEPMDVDFEIIFEDEHIVVINKPQNLSVHPTETENKVSLVHGLLKRVDKLSDFGKPFRPGIVHRIDKNTSGILVVAKSNSAHIKLVEMFSEHSLHREYIALCYGNFAAHYSKKISTLIGRNPNDRLKMSIDVKNGKQAVSHFEGIENLNNTCLIKAVLETGRTHQVRVHLSHLGHSIVGDNLYGVPTESALKWKSLSNTAKNAISTLPGQLLHARRLDFKHPIFGNPLTFETPLPPTFQHIISLMKTIK